MLFVSSFCLHLAVTTDGVFLKANLGRRRCLRSLAVLKSGPEKPGLQEVGGSWWWRGLPMGGEPESAGLGRGVPWVRLGMGGQRGTRCPSGRPPVIRESSHCCRLTDTRAPARVGSDVSCHEGKWHLSRAFFRPALPAGAAKSAAGSAGPRPGRPGWGCPSARACCHWGRQDTVTRPVPHQPSPWSLAYGRPHRALWPH